MAAYARSVISLLSREQRAFLTRETGVVVASKRYVRGLRRKPVRVLQADNQPVESKGAQQHVKEKEEARVRSSEDRGSVKARTPVQPPVKHAPRSVGKDQVDGLRFERAVPGDKRLA